MKGFLSVLKSLVLPRSENEDSARKEFILNILLSGSIFLFLTAVMIGAINFIVLEAERLQNNSMSLVALFLILSFFVFLYQLSRRGRARTASYLFILPFFLLAAYMSLHWGVDVNAALLMFILVITMSGVLISTKFSFMTAVVTIGSIVVIDALQKSGLIEVNRYWRSGPWTTTDTIMTAVIIAIIALISWLSNRETEKSLARARRSEAELKEERDMLEERVHERTKELKEVQLEKMQQLYRFAEFGRLSAGLFHDLINPLNAVSLNMEKLRSESGPVAETANYVDRAVMAAKKMEALIIGVRKQLSREENRTIFCPAEELKSVVDILAYKAKKAGVKIRLFVDNGISIFGDATKFNQVALNLVANAIDAYLPDNGNNSDTGGSLFYTMCGSADGAENKERMVDVELNKDGKTMFFSVRDHGAGITEENKERIFDPFFTTKAKTGGIGIGLSMTRLIIERDFNGTISVESRGGEGATFTVKIGL